VNKKVYQNKMCLVRRTENSESRGWSRDRLQSANRTWRQNGVNDNDIRRHVYVTGGVIWRSAPARAGTWEPATVDLLHEIHRQATRCV